MQIQEQLGKEKMPSILKNPFNKNSVKRIYVSFSEYSNRWSANGSVEFQNGNTTGEQKFTGQTFDDVVIQIKEFVKELECLSE